jgi:hypothetical protein
MLPKFSVVSASLSQLFCGIFYKRQMLIATEYPFPKSHVYVHG